MKTYTQLLEELIEAKGKLVPHEVFTKIKNQRTPEEEAYVAHEKERLAKKTSGRKNMNDPPDVHDVELIKSRLNAIRVGDKSGATEQGFHNYMQNLKKGKYTDAEVGGTRFDDPKWRGEYKGK